MDFHVEQITEEIEVQVHVSHMAVNTSPNSTSEEDQAPTSRVPTNDELKKTIFSLAMKGEWKEVVDRCKKWPFILREKITSTEDTILHLAVIDDKPDILRKLAGLVNDGKILEIANDMGNTLLHLAAANGKTGIADYLINKHKELIKICNKDKETPLFVAALNGKKNTFLYLLSKCPPEEDIVYWRGRDGNSVLHVAISGEYFDLAFQILKKCNNQSYKPDLVNFRNERGESPLHLLANNPSAFKSRSRFNRLQKILYPCIIVSSLEEDNSSSVEENVDKFSLPANYGTCMELIAVIRKIFKSTILNCRGCHVGESKRQGGSKLPFPRIYETMFNGLELLLLLLEAFGLGFIRIQKLREKKQKHTWASQILEELVSGTSTWEYDAGTVRDRAMESSPKGDKDFSFLQQDVPPDDAEQKVQKELPGQKDKSAVKGKRESPILVAAIKGAKEMVEKIIDTYPVAIRDVNQDGKNVVLLAVENRQPYVYKLLWKRTFAAKDSSFQKVDNCGNSALHLAATLGHHKPWNIPGAALQMQWEIKWYKFVKRSMPRHFFTRLNYKGQTAKEVFTETHKELVENGGKWLTGTAESCSVVAALIATVAFATATTVPGGVKETGTPTLEGKPAFEVFAITSLIALCFSVTSLTMFLAILTSRYQESDFRVSLPGKLIFGLTSLFVSIASILISFCAGHFFVLKDELKIAAFPVYAVTCLPITFFAVAQFPLYMDLLRSFIAKVPQRTYEATSL